MLSEVEWRGRSVAVRSERVRVFLLAERALDASLGQNVGDNIELLESHLMDCKDAIGTVKEEVKQDPVGICKMITSDLFISLFTSA